MIAKIAKTSRGGNSRFRNLLKSGGFSMAVLSMSVFADTATITVPQNVDATLDEAIAAGYMTGVADYAGLLTAGDLVVDGPGRLVIDRDLRAGGYAGEVHVVAGATLRLTVSGALGDTAHGTFVADGATLETWTDGEQNSLNFLGEPLSFAGTGVDGDGALVSLTTASNQRRASWGGTVLTMTGDALVHVKGTKIFDFPYQFNHANSSLDMNGHTLTFCGPYSSGTSTITLPLRLDIANPGHIVVSNGLYISVNHDNNFRGDAANTFTIADAISRFDLFAATTSGAMPWSLVFGPQARNNAFLSSDNGGRYDGPIVWQNVATVPSFVVTASSGGGDVVFGGAFSSETGLTVANGTKGANHDLYRPTLAFNGRGNRIGGTLRVSDLETAFVESAPSLDGVEIVNTKLSVGGGGDIAGLWKGINQDYLSWNITSAPSETRCREDFMNNYRGHKPSDWTFYTNSVALGPDAAMNATKPDYGKTALVTYKGYIWNTGGNRVITFLTQVHGYVLVKVERAADTWNGPDVTDVKVTSGPVGVRLASNGAYKIAIALALHDGKGGSNGSVGGDYGIMYRWGSSTSTSTDPNDYLPLMDPGDGSLFTRVAPGDEEYDAIYGTEPFELSRSVTGDASSTLSLGGGNYCVGAVTGAVTVVLDAAMPHAEHAAFTVADELHCRAADLVAGEHLTVTGALKFAEGSILSVSGTKSFPDYGTFVAAESTEAIVGVPALVSGVQSRLKLKAYASPSDGKKLLIDVAPKGTVMFFR